MTAYGRKIEPSRVPFELPWSIGFQLLEEHALCRPSGMLHPSYGLKIRPRIKKTLVYRINYIHKKNYKFSTKNLVTLVRCRHEPETETETKIS